MSDLLAALTSTERRTALTALRDILAAELEPTEHEAGCGCECGPPPADGRVVASLSKELRAVLIEIDKLPGGEAVSDLDRIAARVEAGRDDLAERRESRRAAGADPPRT